MKLGEISEKSFIEGVLVKYLAGKPALSHLEFPDDASDFIPLAPRTVVSVDASSIASVKLPWRSMGDAAWSIASGAVSDHVAKASRPAYAFVSMGLAPDMSVEEAESILEGLNQAFTHYGVKWLGGDTNRSGDPWISVTIVGFTTAKKPPSRRGAREGDVLVVTGRYGAMGYAVARGFNEAARQTWVVENTRRPLVDLRVGTVIALNYKSVHASMDVSDGLGYTLLEVARSSNVGLKIRRPPLLYNEVYEVCDGKLECLYELALNGGEEYGVVMAVDRDGLKKVLEDLDSYDVEYEVVGEVSSGGGLIVEGLASTRIYRWDQFAGYVKYI